MLEDLGWKNLAERRRDLSLAFFLPARRYASADTSYGSVSVCLCLSVCICLLQVGVLSRRMNESSWFLAWELFSTYPACILRKFGYLQSKSTFFWNFVPNSRLRKFRHGISIVEACYQLCSTKMDAQNVINWTVNLRALTVDRYSLSK